MPINSRAKGARREREACEFLAKYQIEARRSQQYKGTADSSDIEPVEDCNYDTEKFFDRFHVEVKGREVFRLYAWLEKADSECDKENYQYPILLYKKNGKPWTITMYADHFMRLPD